MNAHEELALEILCWEIESKLFDIGMADAKQLSFKKFIEKLKLKYEITVKPDESIYGDGNGY